MNHLLLLSFALPDSNTIILLVGCFLLIVGVLGGGFEVKELKIPAVAPLPRVISGVLGLALLGISLGLIASHGGTPAGTDGGNQGASSSAYSTRVGASQAGNDQPFFMTRTITEAEIASKSKLELSEMRNEIYARHGREFSDPNIQAYFSQQSWYKPLYKPQDFPPSLLTQVQLSNLQLLAAKEKERQ